MWHDFLTLILSDRMRIVWERELSMNWRAWAVRASNTIYVIGIA